MFKLGEPGLLGSKKIAYENGTKNFHKKHPGSIIILKMVNDHSMTVFRCYFCINKGHDCILLVHDKKVTKAT